MAPLPITVVGAGLAGSECAFQLAEAGHPVRLLEQKPVKRTPAQQTDGFAELVCSNSFRGAARVNAVGQIKEEMRRSGSLIIRVADETAVPAGGALAVDRVLFSAGVSAALHGHPNIEVVAGEVTEIPPAADGPVVIATGPLTGDRLAKAIEATVGQTHLAYYDAIAPVVDAETIDWDRVFRASRYDKGGDDAYVNCPMTEAAYLEFVEALLRAEKVVPRDFEEPKFFEGCLPVEVMAARGPLTLCHGPMKPVGLKDPRSETPPFAVVQLRQEDQAASAYNLVGFQTRLTWPEQKRVFRTIPGLEGAEFVRLGAIHRNTFLNAPEVLGDMLELRATPHVHFAGQITGVEGYVESAALGLVLGQALSSRDRGEDQANWFPPATTALGGLYRYLRTPRDSFQPSNVVWSMVTPLEARVKGPRRGRKRRAREQLSERALTDLANWRSQSAGDVAAGVVSPREAEPDPSVPVRPQ